MSSVHRICACSICVSVRGISSLHSCVIFVVCIGTWYSEFAYVCGISSELSMCASFVCMVCVHNITHL